MKRNARKIWNLLAAAAFIALPFLAANANAETRVVRLAKQYGISYLPLAIIEDKGLIEAEGKKLGLDLRTEWTRFTGGPPMNEALISGNLDFASGGSGPLITAWARTRDNIKIRGICALNSMPQWLNTTNPERQDNQGFHGQGPHRPARRARGAASDHPANGGGKSMGQRRSAQARQMDGFAQPSRRSRATFERPFGDYSALHLRAFYVQGA